MSEDLKVEVGGVFLPSVDDFLRSFPTDDPVMIEVRPHTLAARLTPPLDAGEIVDTVLQEWCVGFEHRRDVWTYANAKDAVQKYIETTGEGNPTNTGRTGSGDEDVMLPAVGEAAPSPSSGAGIVEAWCEEREISVLRPLEAKDTDDLARRIDEELNEAVLKALGQTMDAISERDEARARVAELEKELRVSRGDNAAENAERMEEKRRADSAEKDLAHIRKWLEGWKKRAQKAESRCDGMERQWDEVEQRAESAEREVERLEKERAEWERKFRQGDDQWQDAAARAESAEAEVERLKRKAQRVVDNYRRSDDQSLSAEARSTAQHAHGLAIAELIIALRGGAEKGAGEGNDPSASTDAYAHPPSAPPCEDLSPASALRAVAVVDSEVVTDSAPPCEESSIEKVLKAVEMFRTPEKMIPRSEFFAYVRARLPAAREELEEMREGLADARGTLSALQVELNARNEEIARLQSPASLALQEAVRRWQERKRSDFPDGAPKGWGKATSELFDFPLSADPEIEAAERAVLDAVKAWTLNPRNGPMTKSLIFAARALTDAKNKNKGDDTK